GRARALRARDAPRHRRALALARRARARRRRAAGPQGERGHRGHAPQQRGGKASEDIAVPLDKLGEAIQESLEVGRRLGVPACSWGHAGDGNLHTTFLLAGDDERELALAPKLSEALFELSLRLGGTISGEHGVGFVKRNWLAEQLGPRAYELH